MKQSELEILAGKAIDEYFMNIDNVVDDIVSNIIDKYGLDDDDISEDEKKYLKEKIMRGVLKWDVDNNKSRIEQMRDEGYMQRSQGWKKEMGL